MFWQRISRLSINFDAHPGLTLPAPLNLLLKGGKEGTGGERRAEAWGKGGRKGGGVRFSLTRPGNHILGFFLPNYAFAFAS